MVASIPSLNFYDGPQQVMIRTGKSHNLMLQKTKHASICMYATTILSHSSFTNFVLSSQLSPMGTTAVKAGKAEEAAKIVTYVTMQR